MYKKLTQPINYRRFTLLFIFILAGLCNLKSQNIEEYKNTIDSLKTLAENAPNDTVLLFNYTLMARDYRFIDADSSKFFLKKIIKLHKEKNALPTIHAFAYNVIADIYRLELDLDSAKHYYQEGYNYFSTHQYDDALLAIAPPYANFLVKNQEVTNGIEIFNNAIQIASKNNDQHSLAYLYTSFGNVLYSVQKDFDRAKLIFKKGAIASQYMKDSINFRRVNSGIHLGISQLFFEENKIDSALHYAKSAYQYSDFSRYTEKVITSLNLITRCYILKDNLNQAKEYQQKAELLYPNIQSVEQIINSQINKQSILNKSNNQRASVAVGKELLMSHLDELTNEQKISIYDNLLDSYLNIGDTADARRTKDSLIYYTKTKYQSEHASLLSKFYDETLINEEKLKNEILRIEQQESEKRIKLQTKSLFGLILLSIFTLLFGIGTYFLYKQKKSLSQDLENKVEERTQRLRITNEDLIRTNEELRTFTYIASHDIKEPMRNIGTYIGLIKLKLPESIQNSLKENFVIIDHSLKRLYTLLEDLTSYIMLSKKEFIEFEEVELNSIVDDIKDELLTSGNSKKINIQHEGLKSLRTNKAAIYLILKNIIHNGLKYNQSKIPTVTINQVISQHYHTLYLIDNGIGMPEEYLDQIFEISKRLHNKNEFEGSGLGLAITKVLMQKLNGEIAVQSELEVGSTFILKFPITN